MILFYIFVVPQLLYHKMFLHFRNNWLFYINTLVGINSFTIKNLNDVIPNSLIMYNLILSSIKHHYKIRPLSQQIFKIPDTDRGINLQWHKPGYSILLSKSKYCLQMVVTVTLWQTQIVNTDDEFIGNLCIWIRIWCFCSGIQAMPWGKLSPAYCDQRGPAWLQGEGE